MSVINQLFRMVSVWRDFNQNQLIETYLLKNHIDLHRLRLNQISKQNSEHKKAGGVLGLGRGYVSITLDLSLSSLLKQSIESYQ